MQFGIILALNLKNKGEQVILVTEETESSNDNKLFKKIPAICKELEIETITLPELIAKYDGIDIDFQQKTYAQQPFAAMGANVVKSSALLLSTFVVG